MTQPWLDDTHDTTDILSGHRPITFDADMENYTVPQWSREMDLLLIAKNRVIASTAAQGRYAAGERFFARDPSRFASLLAVCENDDGFLAFPFLRSVALVCGAAARETELLLVVVVHGNAKRTLRLLQHCFSDCVRRTDAVSGIGGPPIGGLRRTDEALYHVLHGLLLRCRLLLAGAGCCSEVSNRAQLTALLVDRMHLVWETLGLPAPVCREEPLPFPCVGTVNPCVLTVMMLCLGLEVYAQAERGATLCMVSDDRRLCPHFVLSMPPSKQEAVMMRAVSLRESLAITYISHLALRHGTTFECDVDRGVEGMSRLHLRISPLCPRYGDLYVLHSQGIFWDER
ncbi:MAG: hypothetical protein IJW40_08255 [Clostridia bacterium]|nr:hypothetical protein [Clostridia bacterium]